MSKTSELFESYDNHQKIITIAENFLRVSSCMQDKQHTLVEASEYTEQGKLSVLANVKWQKSRVDFKAIFAELAIDNHEGQMSLRVNRDWDESQKEWVNDNYSDFIIKQFVELHPVDLTDSSYAKDVAARTTRSVPV